MQLQQQPPSAVPNAQQATLLRLLTQQQAQAALAAAIPSAHAPQVHQNQRQLPQQQL
jgi:hypothetical protein